MNGLTQKERNTLQFIIRDSFDRNDQGFDEEAVRCSILIDIAEKSGLEEDFIEELKNDFEFEFSDFIY